jgi:hypothetical protein
MFHAKIQTVNFSMSLSNSRVEHLIGAIRSVPATRGVTNLEFLWYEEEAQQMGARRRFAALPVVSTLSNLRLLIPAAWILHEPNFLSRNDQVRKFTLAIFGGNQLVHLTRLASKRHSRDGGKSWTSSELSRAA